MYDNIGSSGKNIASFLVPTYIGSIPIDPESGCNDVDTCYDVCIGSDGRFNIVSPNSNGSEDSESESTPTPTPDGREPASPII